jgi:hypothetical protein
MYKKYLSFINDRVKNIYLINVNRTKLFPNPLIPAKIEDL